MVDVRMFTVGPIQENCYLVRASDEATEAILVDPGAEADRLLGAIEELGATLAGILLTHTHFDHVGAVAELAEATGAEVWVPELEHEILRTFDQVMEQRGGMFAQFGPFRPFDAQHRVSGGDVVELAGLTFDVVFAPGHSPATWSTPRARRRSCSPATCCFRARSAAPICPAAITHACSSRSRN